MGNRVKRRQNKLMYLLIDQQKAFDRLDHLYLFKILRANNLPAKFINWVELMYKDVKSKVEVNGAYTNTINIERSVRQGCPLSMLLFIIGLLDKLQTNKNTKGYPINRFLFGVLRRFQHCTGHITTGSWKGRGNQYI